MRRSFIVVAFVAMALAVPMTAFAGKAPVPSVVCGTACDGGGGTPYCGQFYHEDYSNPIPGDWYRVWLGINWCVNGSSVTSVSPYTYGCQAGGDYGCGSTNGPFLIGGGAGQGYATYQYSANLTFGAPFPLGMNTSKTVTCTVYASGASSC